MRTLFACAVTFCVLCSTSRSDVQPAKNGDWPQWRGPNRDAICIETGLLKQWPKGGPTLLWNSQKVNGGKSVGAGYSSLAITQDKIFTLGDRGKNEGCHVFCLDANTGKEVWAVKIGPNANPGGYKGPRCIPTVDDDRVYAIHPGGLLVCLKVSDGSLLWQKDFVKNFAGNVQNWGYCESPTIDGEKLICTPGSKEALFVALNKLTGDVIWKTSLPGKLSVGSAFGYSSIVISNAAGVKQYINVTGSSLGLAGVDAKTGKFLWNYSKAVRGTANIPTAIVKDDYVFTTTGYGAGAALLKLSADGQGGVKAQEQYYLPGNKLTNTHGGVVMIGDYIYGGHGHNRGAPFCLEWKTGKFAWGPESDADKGSTAVLYADGRLYFRFQNGDVVLVEANPKSYVTKGSFHINLGSNNWPHPVIYHGKLYLRGDDQILCYDIKQK